MHLSRSTSSGLGTRQSQTPGARGFSHKYLPPLSHPHRIVTSVGTVVYISFNPWLQSLCEPVWPSGKALGWEAEGPRFDPLRLSFLFSSKIVVYGHCLVALPTQLMKH